jgi:hypothetical protein
MQDCPALWNRDSSEELSLTRDATPLDRGATTPIAQEEGLPDTLGSPRVTVAHGCRAPPSSPPIGWCISAPLDYRSRVAPGPGWLLPLPGGSDGVLSSDIRPEASRSHVFLFATIDRGVRRSPAIRPLDSAGFCGESWPLVGSSPILALALPFSPGPVVPHGYGVLPSPARLLHCNQPPNGVASLGGFRSDRLLNYGGLCFGPVRRLNFRSAVALILLRCQ